MYYRREVVSRGINYDDDEIYIEVQKLLVGLSMQDKTELIDRFAMNARELAYRSILQNNYDQIFREVAFIVKSELERIRTARIANDPRIFDPTFGLD